MLTKISQLSKYFIFLFLIFYPIDFVSFTPNEVGSNKIKYGHKTFIVVDSIQDISSNNKWLEAQLPTNAVNNEEKYNDENYINILKSGSEFERENSAIQIAKSRNKQKALLLLPLMTDKSSITRKYSARALIYLASAIGDSEVISVILPYLNNNDEAKKHNSALALAVLGYEGCRDELIEMLHNKDTFIKDLASDALSQLMMPIYEMEQRAKDNIINAKWTVEIYKGEDDDSSYSLVLKMRERRYPAYRVARLTSKNTIEYRVCIGGFYQPDDAIYTSQSLFELQGIPNSVVTVSESDKIFIADIQRLYITQKLRIPINISLKTGDNILKVLWSPDSRFIAFIISRANLSLLYLYDSDENIYNSFGQFVENIVWSYSGRRLTFSERLYISKDSQNIANLEKYFSIQSGTINKYIKKDNNGKDYLLTISSLNTDDITTENLPILLTSNNWIDNDKSIVFQRGNEWWQIKTDEEKKIPVKVKNWKVKEKPAFSPLNDKRLFERNKDNGMKEIGICDDDGEIERIITNGVFLGMTQDGTKIAILSNIDSEDVIYIYRLGVR